jgi:transmembrane sensor
MTGNSASLIRDEAATWVARMDADHWDDRQEAELQAWLDGDDRRRGALLQAQAAWMTLDKLLASEAAADNDVGDDVFRAPPSRRRFLWGGGGAIAASVAFALAWNLRGTSYETSIGEIRRVPLADGSVAAINTASRIDVALAETRRDVRLDRGEAWFQVAKDSKRPFVVEAGRIRVRAVGTAFSVRRRDNGADILVTEGVVEAWADGAEGNRIRLTAGQSAFVADNAAIERSAVESASVDRKLAWRSGKIDLLGETLSGAIAEFNRYNRRQIILADPALGSEQFDGVFRTDDPEGFAIAVKSALDVPVDTSGSADIRIGLPGR